MKIKKIPLKSPSLRINITDLLFLLFVIIEIFRFFKVIPLIIANIFFVIIGATIIFYVCKKKGLRMQFGVLTFMFIYIFFGILGVLLNGNSDFQEVLWPIAFMGGSLLLLNFDINYKLTKKIYYYSILAFVIKVISSGSINNIEIVSSRNAISVLVILLFSFYAISSYKHNKKINFIPVISGLVVVILAVGRSGILTFLLLLFFFLIFKFEGKRQNARGFINIIIILVPIVILSLILYRTFGTYITDAINNFESRGLESVRTLLWKEYFEKVSKSFMYIMFGAPITGSTLLDAFNNNLHNSFLMLHAKYGVIILISVITLIIRTMIFYIRRKNYLYLTLLTIILFRMQFDYTNFNAQLDIILWYLIFYPKYHNLSNV